MKYLRMDVKSESRLLHFFREGALGSLQSSVEAFCVQKIWRSWWPSALKENFPNLRALDLGPESCRHSITENWSELCTALGPALEVLELHELQRLDCLRTNLQYFPKLRIVYVHANEFCDPGKLLELYQWNPRPHAWTVPPPKLVYLLASIDYAWLAGRDAASISRRTKTRASFHLTKLEEDIRAKFPNVSIDIVFCECDSFLERSYCL